MFTGTFHRLGQLGPCLCGSARSFLLCHLARFDGDRPCLSGQPFKSCHRIDPRDPAVAAHRRLYAPEFEATSAHLRAEWESQFPSEQAPSAAARVPVGRNAPCPCGSGLKSKKCLCDSHNED